MDAVRNCWIVAGFAREVDASLRRFRLLGEDILLYRRGDGSPVALEDRCPHRLLPLSHGKRVGDGVQCGYHGMTFGPDGACTRIPGQDRIPRGAWVPRYPVTERHGLVWVWPGDPALADESSLFDLPQLHDPAWALHHGDRLELASGYLNVAENLCDPAHVSFVHPTTLGNAASEDIPVRTERPDPDLLVTSRWVPDGPPVGFFQHYGGFSGLVDRWHYYELHIPYIAVIDFGSADAALKISPDERDKGVRLFALHFLTPVDETHTIDRWCHLRNLGTDDAELPARMDQLFRTAFAEDKAILEAIAAEELAGGASRVTLAIDRGPNLYRARVRQRIAAEREAAQARMTPVCPPAAEPEAAAIDPAP